MGVGRLSCEAAGCRFRSLADARVPAWLAPEDALPPLKRGGWSVGP